jgi:two-component sensor histidine kinase
MKVSDNVIRAVLYGAEGICRTLFTNPEDETATIVFVGAIIIDEDELISVLGLIPKDFKIFRTLYDLELETNHQLDVIIYTYKNDSTYNTLIEFIEQSNNDNLNNTRVLCGGLAKHFINTVIEHNVFRILRDINQSIHGQNKSKLVYNTILKSLKHFTNCQAVSLVLYNSINQYYYRASILGVDEKKLKIRMWKNNRDNLTYYVGCSKEQIIELDESVLYNYKSEIANILNIKKAYGLKISMERAEERKNISGVGTIDGVLYLLFDTPNACLNEYDKKHLEAIIIEIANVVDHVLIFEDIRFFKMIVDKCPHPIITTKDIFTGVFAIDGSPVFERGFVDLINESAEKTFGYKSDFFEQDSKTGKIGVKSFLFYKDKYMASNVGNMMIQAANKHMPPPDPISGYALMKSGNSFFAIHSGFAFKYHGNVVGTVGFTQNIQNVVDLEAKTQLDKKKTSVLAQIIHELEAPFNTIYWRSNRILKKGIMDPPDIELIRKNTGVILKEAKNSIDNIENLSKIEELDAWGEKRKELNVVKSRFDIVELLENLKSEYDERVMDESILIEVRNLGHNSIVLSNEGILKFILRNLINNSIKYRRPSIALTKITLTYEETDVKYWSISVKDDGIGIPHDELKNIFKPYYRGKSQEVQVKDGMGIGMAAVKGYLEILDRKGEIDISSNVGVGTTVKITFRKD